MESAPEAREGHQMSVLRASLVWALRRSPKDGEDGHHHPSVSEGSTQPAVYMIQLGGTSPSSLQWGDQP